MSIQLGFFDLHKRYAQLSALGDPLEKLDALIPWEDFRPLLEGALPRKDRSRGGRTPLDAVLMFKALVLQILYDLGDEATEYQIGDRLSFMRFLGLSLGDRAPDSTSIRNYREYWANAGLIDEMFARFDTYLKMHGFLAMSGQIVDACIVEAPRQRNSKEENEQVKAGQVPDEWKEKPAKLRQKDCDARWTKKRGKSFYGYKNHVNVDNRHKLIRRFVVTDAAQHDSTAFEKLLDPSNTAMSVWADSAYRSQEIETMLENRGLKSRIHLRAYANRPLNGHQKRSNRARSTVRARVEHPFGDQRNGMGLRLVRTIGLARATFKLGMANLVYNMRRFEFLMRGSPQPNCA